MSDKFERFLRGYMTARRLVRELGLDDLANPLVAAFQGLQCSHDRIVQREARKLTQGVLRTLRSGNFVDGSPIKVADLADLLEMKASELKELESLLKNPKGIR